MNSAFFSIFMVFVLAFVSCKTPKQPTNFITVNGTQFIKKGEPYYYIGANYWYGANLASDTIGGDRKRLINELDFMKAKGIDNLRILVGAEGPDNQPYRVSPTTIKAPGVYSPALLEGLDYLLNELRKRDMVAVLYLTNNWEWSGGMAQYLNWNGYGEFVNPNLEQFNWNDFMQYQQQFYNCEPCKKQVNDYIRFVISRTNTVNGVEYKNDPTIMAWELANEPRPMTVENENLFKDWVKTTSELIKSIDPNHLVATGSEGEKGCNNSLTLFKEIHTLPSIDYLTFHIWIKNWGWYNYTKPDSTMPLALKKVQQYFDNHIQVAEQLNKPLVLEEFGLARDFESYNIGTPTIYRDTYYRYAFDQINKSILNNKALVACNFWAFGGYVEQIPGRSNWLTGDPYSGDPPQEPQGLNTVFVSDTATLSLIENYNHIFGRLD